LTVQSDKARTKDLRELKKMLKNVPADRIAIGAKIIEEIAFMTRTLAKLKAEVEENGVVDHFKQGSQEFMRESPALKAYNTTIQRYSLLYKQFADLLPKPEPPDNLPDELSKFLENQG
jgi:hypothetical protein